MADEWLEMVNGKPAGPRIGSWIGAVVCALGIGACLAMVTFGSAQLMNAGGFVASGGPYQIAHPAPEGSWLFPLPFIGLFVFSSLHTAFAWRIKAPRLNYATWCALWTSVGAVTFWYGLYPPQGSGPAWGWLIMGGVFLLVGFGSIATNFATQNIIEWSHAEMTGRRLVVYWVLTSTALVMGVGFGATFSLR